MTVQKAKVTNMPDWTEGTRKWNSDWIIVTCYVRTILQLGKMEEVADQILKYKIDAIALQEIRWNERICKIRLKDKFRNTTLISAYGPTEGSNENLKMDYYHDLMTQKYIKIILGDFNAQVETKCFT